MCIQYSQTSYVMYLKATKGETCFCYPFLSWKIANWKMDLCGRIWMRIEYSSEEGQYFACIIFENGGFEKSFPSKLEGEKCILSRFFPQDKIMQSKETDFFIIGWQIEFYYVFQGLTIPEKLEKGKQIFELRMYYFTTF